MFVIFFLLIMEVFQINASASSAPVPVNASASSAALSGQPLSYWRNELAKISSTRIGLINNMLLQETQAVKSKCFGPSEKDRRYVCTMAATSMQTAEDSAYKCARIAHLEEKEKREKEALALFKTSVAQIDATVAHVNASMAKLDGFGARLDALSAQVALLKKSEQAQESKEEK